MARGDTFQPPWAPPEIPWDVGGHPHTLRFAFWTIVGGADGPLATDLPLPQSVRVGTSNITAMAVYVDTTDVGDGQPGVWVDAFDVSRGDFVDDIFVTVQPDEQLTPLANEEGFVPTHNAEQVIAFAAIHNVPFSKWDVVLGDVTATDRDLKANAKISAVAFTFYHLPAQADLPRVDTGDTPIASASWVSWGVKVDGGGPTSGGPVPPWEPRVRDIAAGLALAAAAKNVSPTLRPKVLELAMQQVTIGTQEVTKAIKQDIEQELDARKR